MAAAAAAVGPGGVCGLRKGQQCLRRILYSQFSKEMTPQTALVRNEKIALIFMRYFAQRNELAFDRSIFSHINNKQIKLETTK